MNREQCIDALTTTLREYIRAIMDEAQIGEDEAREVASQCARHIAYAIELHPAPDEA